MNGCIYHTADDLCMKFSVGDTRSWCVGKDEPCDYRKPSNADRIRSMTDEELARFIHDQIIDRNIGVPSETWLDWLRQEEENEPITEA